MAPRYTRSILPIVVLLSATPVVVAQPPPPDDPVATTDRFVFHSRFPLNLHDGLIRAALAREAPDSACLRGLAPEEREGWDRAVARYRDSFTATEDRRLPVLVRLHLAGLADQLRRPLEPMPEEVERALADGAAAYRACWWSRDDAANRRWIDALLPMLDDVEAEVSARLAAAYQTEWLGSRIPVDVVPYVSRQGAHTIRPPHILITSSGTNHQGRAALEAIFHEASHTIIGPRAGEPSRRLQEVAEGLGVAVPSDLWHVVLFYTTGEIVRDVIAERYGEEYQQYLYATGLFERGWPELRHPIERWWKPYLDGSLQLTDAVEGLLQDLAR